MNESGISEDVLDKLRAEHGKVFQLTHKDEYTDETVSVVVKRPKLEYKQFRAAAMDDDKRRDATENLFRRCVVHPDAAGVSAILSEYPALAETWGSECLKMAGATRETEVKKL